MEPLNSSNNDTEPLKDSTLPEAINNKLESTSQNQENSKPIIGKLSQDQLSSVKNNLANFAANFKKYGINIPPKEDIEINETYDQLSKAINDCRTAVSKCETNQVLMIEIESIIEKLGNFTEKYSASKNKHINEAIKERQSLQHMLAIMYLMMNELEQSLKVNELIVKERPNDIKAKLRTIFTLRKLGRKEDSEGLTEELKLNFSTELQQNFKDYSILLSASDNNQVNIANEIKQKKYHLLFRRYLSSSAIIYSISTFCMGFMYFRFLKRN